MASALIGQGIAGIALALGGGLSPVAPPPPVAPSPNVCLPGTGSLGWCGDGGPATRAKLARPGDVAVAPDGAVIVADTQNQVIRRVDPSGVIVTIAGNGARGAARARVSARRATFRYPRGVAVDGDGSVLVADSGNDALRRIDGSGGVTTIAAGLRRVADVVVAAPGEYLVAVAGDNRVLRVAADGTKSPVAGTGRRGFGGDGGPADRARLDRPTALAVSMEGLLIADTGNGAVRLVRPDGSIATVAGRPPAAPPGPTQATRVALGRPLGVAATPDGGFVVGAATLLWQVGPDGVAHVLAGTARPGFNTDAGTALATRLEPTQLALAGDGAIVLADTRNDRIRRVAVGRVATLAGSGRPSLRLAPVVLAPFVGTTGPGSAAQRRRGYRPALQPVARPSAAHRPPRCARSSTIANVLKIRPYTRRLIRSPTRPIVIRFGSSVNAAVTGYAWRRDGTTFGTSRVRRHAGTGRIRLRGTLRPGRYVAVLRGRSRGGVRSCDARALRVVRP
jgi:hypothetical protein